MLRSHVRCMLRRLLVVTVPTLAMMTAAPVEGAVAAVNNKGAASAAAAAGSAPTSATHARERFQDVAGSQLNTSSILEDIHKYLSPPVPVTVASVVEKAMNDHKKQEEDESDADGDADADAASDAVVVAAAAVSARDDIKHDVATMRDSIEAFVKGMLDWTVETIEYWIDGMNDKDAVQLAQGLKEFKEQQQQQQEQLQGPTGAEQELPAAE